MRVEGLSKTTDTGTLKALHRYGGGLGGGCLWSLRWTPAPALPLEGEGAI
jgi:hypothetical protein